MRTTKFVLTFAATMTAAGLAEVHGAETQFGDTQPTVAAQLDGFQHRARLVEYW